MDRQTIEREFWQQKIKEYIADKNKWGNPTQEENQADTEQFLAEFISKLKEMYGENRVEISYRTTSYRRKEYVLWEISVYPAVKEIDETCFLCIKYDFSRNTDKFYFGISNKFSWYSYWFRSSKVEDLLNLVSKYCDEYSDNKEVLEKKLLEAEKKEKIKKVAQQSIKTIVETKMAGTGYKWDLQEEQTRCVLRIKMKRGKMIELTLGYKSFTEKIPEMLEVIKQMENLLETIPYPVNIRSYGKNIEWKG